jgi:hypothetical protein
VVATAEAGATDSQLGGRTRRNRWVRLTRIRSGEVDIKFNDRTVVKAVWNGCPAQPSITVT